MKLTIVPMQDIEFTPYEFTGKDGASVQLFTGRGLCNPCDPIFVRFTSKKPFGKLPAREKVEVVLKEFSRKGEIPVAKVSLA